MLCEWMPLYVVTDLFWDANADTSGLLAEMTMASAAGEPAAEVEAIDMDDAAEDLLTPPAQQQAALTPLSQVAFPLYLDSIALPDIAGNRPVRAFQDMYV